MTQIANQNWNFPQIKAFEMTNDHNFTLMQEVKIFFGETKACVCFPVLAQTEVLLACTAIGMHV